MDRHDLGPVSGAAIVLEGVRSKIKPTGTLVIKSNSDEMAKVNDADKLRTKSYERREEGAKNLEEIRDRLKEISVLINEDINNKSMNLKFSLDKITNRMLVTVSDKESGKIIKQIPSDTILKVAHSLEALKGILYDDKY